MLSSLGASLIGLLLASSVSAHTRVWSVYVNGVDQGTGVGIRDPLPEGPPPSGFSNWPMRNVLSPDMQCHVMGDVQDLATIKVQPGDVMTFDFHHNDRTATDDIIASSHRGPCMIYLSPDPPGQNTWVKLWEQGMYNGNTTWCTTGSLTDAKGKLNVAIPADLAPGYYLIRPELIALHEGDTMWNQDNNRGAQFYFECVQIQVIGTGTTTLPPGVSFPGVYDFSDPGIHFSAYATVGISTYPIPGPTVWSGAAPSPTAPVFGTNVGLQTNAPNWSTWVNGYTTTNTITASRSGGLTTFVYTPSWSTTYNTPGVTHTSTTTAKQTTTTVVTTTTTTTTKQTSSIPISTSTTTTKASTTTAQPTTTSPPAATQTHYGQCGGQGYSGPTTCAAPYLCKISNPYYAQEFDLDE